MMMRTPIRAQHHNTVPQKTAAVGPRRIKHPDVASIARRATSTVGTNWATVKGASSFTVVARQTTTTAQRYVAKLARSQPAARAMRSDLSLEGARMLLDPQYMTDPATTASRKHEITKG